jgi:hypothetical protein
MPIPYKVLISVLALVVAVTVFYLSTQAGGGAERWVALALGPMMVVAIWIFPEAKAREIRKEAGRRR